MSSTCVTGPYWKTAAVQCVPCHGSKGELHQVSMQVRFCLRQRDALQKMPSRWIEMEPTTITYRIQYLKNDSSFRPDFSTQKHWRTCDQVTQACATASHARRCSPPRFAQERPPRSGRLGCSCLRCHFPSLSTVSHSVFQILSISHHFPRDFPSISLP